MAYVPKTKVTSQSVEDFLDTVSEKRRNEAHKIIDMKILEKIARYAYENTKDFDAR